MRPARGMIAIAVGTVLLFGCMPTLVSASPSLSVSSAQAALDKAIHDYDEAHARLTAIETSASAEAAELDSLVTRETELQESLGERASYLYRSGPLRFVEVLLDSATFSDFLTRWDALVRIGREDAKTISEIRATRTRLSHVIARLFEQQAAASRDLRALEDATTQARATLSSSQAAYAAYQQQIAAREASASKEAASRAAHATAARPVFTPASSRSSGSSAPWQSAVASCYGTGAYGIHLASGFTIGPDSMIVAHTTLPFGTLVEFSYRGRTAIATVADRGPYVPGRTWDLGPGTARVLGIDGVATVRYRLIRR